MLLKREKQKRGSVLVGIMLMQLVTAMNELADICLPWKLLLHGS